VQWWARLGSAGQVEGGFEACLPEGPRCRLLRLNEGVVLEHSLVEQLPSLRKAQFWRQMRLWQHKRLVYQQLVSPWHVLMAMQTHQAVPVSLTALKETHPLSMLEFLYLGWVAGYGRVCQPRFYDRSP
jgi:hypothetical protein